MSSGEIREPIQKRSIEKKEKIIKSGFELICKNGYYNTDTAKIAKEAGVSTGIIYQYFKDKRDIFMAGLEKYADSIFYPMMNFDETKFKKRELPLLINKMIDLYISNHKLSQTAHEEIMSMIHSDKDVEYFYYKQEIEITHKFSSMLKENGFKGEGLDERVHIAIGIMDNLCHEIVYHKHKNLDYNKMKEYVVDIIVDIIKN